MSRLLTRAVRLIKFGAVAGAAVGVGRLVMSRRRRAAEAESSWPTIAETAAQNGEVIDDEADDGTNDDAASAPAEAGEDTEADSAQS